MADISTRLKALATTLDEEAPVQRDLLRLGDAVSARAKTAQNLVSALEQDVERLPENTDQTSGLSEDTRSALDALASDLNALGVTPSIAHEMAAEGGFTWAT